MKNNTTIISEEPGFLFKTVFIVVVLCSIYFWNLKFFPPIYNIYNILGWVPCILAVLLVRKKSGMNFKYAIYIFLFGIVANFIASYRNMHQSIYESFFSFSFYYFILIYFLLHFLGLGKKFVESTIIVFAVIYSIIFIVQYKVYPDVIFNYSAQTAIDEKQFEILGSGFLVLGYLLALNRFLVNRKVVYIIISLFFLVVLFKCGFRTLIASALVATVLMVIMLIRFDFIDLIMMLVVFLLFIGLTQYKGVSTIINNAVSKTESNIKEGKAYVRNIEKEYYYKVYPRNFSYYIIGGGKPAGRSLYKFDYDIQQVKLNYNIVWVDIGLRGFYFVVGSIALLGLLWWSFKGALIKLPRDGMYLKLYFFYLLFTSFTNEEIYRDGIFTVQAIALYLIDMSLKDNPKAIEPDKSNNFIPLS